jgi:hypothetical protein
MVVVAAGCSGPGGPPCQAASFYDCVKPLTVEAMPCGHPFATPGKFDSTLQHCTYADGTDIDFGQPATASSPGTSPWGFVITQGRNLCLQVDVYEASPNATTTSVVTMNGRYKEVDITDPLHLDSLITCADGLTFPESEARACKATARHIAFAYQAVQATVQFSLGTSGSTTESFEVFQCGL